MRKTYVFSFVIMIALAAFLAVGAFASPSPVIGFDFAAEESDCADMSSVIVLEGLGTQESPYLISNADEFNALQQKVALGETALYASLTDDIDFGGAKIGAVGTKETPFKGHFDGNGKTLNNFVVCEDVYLGVFGYIESAVVEDLYIGTFSVDLTKTAAEKVYVGAVAYAVNSTISKVCVNNDKLDLTGQTKYVYTGAVCGYAESNSNGRTLIEECYNVCDISLVNVNGYGYLGGMVARFVTESGGNCLINHCYNVGSMSATSYNSANVGGLVGYLYSHGSAYSPEIGHLSADVDEMIKNSFSASNVYAKSAAHSSRAGRITGNVNTYATVDTATTLYTTDKSFTVTGTVKNVGTSTTLENLKDESFLSSKLGFDFLSTWTKLNGSTYEYPTFQGTQKICDADEAIDFLAVSSDVSFNSNGNVIKIDKVRIAEGHTLELDRGTYIIGSVEGNANVLASVNANVLIGGTNKPSGYVEIDMGDAANGSIRYAEVNGYQYEIEAEGNIYGIIASDNTMVEIVEKTNINSANASTKYFVACPDSSLVSLDGMNSYMNSTDIYGLRFINNMGIRFKAEIDAVKKSETDSYKIVEYGYILTLQKHLNAEPGTQLNFDFDRKVSGVAYNAADGTDLVFSTENNIDAFTAVLYEIPATGYRYTVVAKTYTKVVVDGKQYVIYGEPMSSSLYDVAQALDYENLTEQQKAVVDEIVK